MITINKINNLSQREFIKIFANIFEKAKWIAKRLYDQKPFNNFEDLCSKMLNIFENTTKENQLIILKAHPDLADKIKIRSLTPNSRKEQSNAGLDQCSEQEFKEFKDLNDKYKKRLGFPFIFAVKGKDKKKILNNFRKRILYDKNKEFTEAKTQVKKIASSRLREIKS
tara:strand:+ start:39 stop:542 length:504 start_codon:yes stop_codon:yes gene_type:complete